MTVMNTKYGPYIRWINNQAKQGDSLGDTTEFYLKKRGDNLYSLQTLDGKWFLKQSGYQYWDWSTEYSSVNNLLFTYVEGKGYTIQSAETNRYMTFINQRPSWAKVRAKDAVEDASYFTVATTSIKPLIAGFEGKTFTMKTYHKTYVRDAEAKDQKIRQYFNEDKTNYLKLEENTEVTNTIFLKTYSGLYVSCPNGYCYGREQPDENSNWRIILADNGQYCFKNVN